MKVLITMITRTFSALQKILSFKDRYLYLKLGGVIGETTFGFDRYLNQVLYTSRRWLKTRDTVIVRDAGCDLAVRDFPISGSIIVHHMNPITIEDIEKERDEIFDPEFLISTAPLTHRAIHYGNESLLPKPLVVRHRNDTCPWLLQN